MALDFSALEENSTATAAEPSGKPLEIPLADIVEDPDQPRKAFTSEAMQEMTESIRARGVKTPVSVHRHPTKPGKWMLNYGARRYRASVAAGWDRIPAFVDESHDDYDQVIENIQRDDLKPMELALFIKKRLDAGDKKTHIAKNLGKDSAIITQHLALIAPPACIEDAYSNGKCTSPKTLYALRCLHEQFPEQVEAWCADTIEITRKRVSQLAEKLKNKPTLKANKTQQCKEKTGRSATLKFGHEQISGITNESSKPKLAPKSEGDGDIGELTSLPEARPTSDPDSISKPLMLIEFDGRTAAVLLNRRPTTAGLIHIRFEDGGGDKEVNAGACKIKLLTEAGK